MPLHIRYTMAEGTTQRLRFLLSSALKEQSAPLIDNVLALYESVQKYPCLPILTRRKNELQEENNPQCVAGALIYKI